MGYLCISGASVVLGSGLSEGLRHAIIAHEIGHFRLHRWELQNGHRLGAQHEREAEAYGAAFLLPVPLLQVDATLLELQARHEERGELPEFYLWSQLQVVAKRFRVTRTLVIERLARLGFLERKGGCLAMAPVQKQLERYYERLLQEREVLQRRLAQTRAAPQA